MGGNHTSHVEKLSATGWSKAWKKERMNDERMRDRHEQTKRRDEDGDIYRIDGTGLMGSDQDRTGQHKGERGPEIGPGWEREGLGYAAASEAESSWSRDGSFGSGSGAVLSLCRCPAVGS